MLAGQQKKAFFWVVLLSLILQVQTSFADTPFSARLINLESDLKNPFRFYLNIKPADGKDIVYELQAELPAGWSSIFRTEGSQVTAVEVTKDKARDLELEIHASPIAKPGKYTIPVKAISGDKTLDLTLEAVVKGHYDLQISTPDGRLSENITEGRTKQIVVTVSNTGTLPQENIELSSTTPSRWQATFEPAKIEKLEPGKTVEVKLQLSAAEKAIAGDYQTTISARTNYSTASANFRITVKTSILSGWLGILVILGAFGIVYRLIKKYGRR
ncbi:hypothetical protein Lbys_3257 [Leadbetterella byssophila DSM 17132]|uniref:Alpha-galactosidase NEW3 domain-containing protein n=1 Tax=Leadbetterella byssophila (strain DSM 17132 / JCM 16389 / KACC 11308 / NBRC 106382 / 4M15) TaxID=649349 RepID=E4RWH7_LEAB4|nr:NEW3 domain-containing protein [Leadbetterella byssophila]ADQ18917.1 hypothetical protein Lbys_3257 [Leadbetterella byssophila DSM 17132]